MTWRYVDREEYLKTIEGKIAHRLDYGFEHYGDEFEGDPLAHLEEELIDALFYVHFARRQRDVIQGNLTTLSRKENKMAEYACSTPGCGNNPMTAYDEDAMTPVDLSDSPEPVVEKPYSEQKNALKRQLVKLLGRVDKLEDARTAQIAINADDESRLEELEEKPSKWETKVDVLDRSIPPIQDRLRKLEDKVKPLEESVALMLDYPISYTGTSSRF